MTIKTKKLARLKPKKISSEKTIPAVRPNVGLEIHLRNQLQKMILAMHDDVAGAILKAYEKNPPEMASDILPAAIMRNILNKMTDKWLKRFDRGARELADYYAQAMSKRSDQALMAILKRAGLTVKFTQSQAVRDVLDATRNEQVGLIRSIAQRHLGDVENLVMRSVANGRDLHYLSDKLQKRYRVTKRRAALIARDQNNKATSQIVRTRQTELGMEEAIWLHSHGGKKPRPTHLANNGKRYNIKTGWYDPDVGEYIWPGELINCRCVSKSIVPGLS